MTETGVPRVADAVARYVRFWNTAPAEQRRSGSETFVGDVTYVAPAGVLTGVDALADFTEQFAGHVGAYRFRARTEPDMHHDHARVQWEIRVGDTSFAEGTDVLTVDNDGRIASVATFLDRAPRTRPHHEGQQDQ
ncbi:nuclear transport factor 2 family protein [Micromonospora sp. NPDC050495]|uniref:nuclear transport factor 2 family protein n=1 Tax=Micromonospora sp. NPDC050495 TaxID=3154936 RepID=UPI0033F457AF